MSATDPSLAARGRLLVALPLAFQVVVLIGLGLVVRSYSASSRDYIREQAVIASTYRLLSLLVDAETGVRGYMLTNDPTFIEPYHHALRQFPLELARLQRLAPGDRVAALREPADHVLANHKRNLDAVQAGRYQDALTRVRNRTGKKLMDAFRRDVDAFAAHYHAEADRQERSAARSMNVLLAGLGAAFVANVVLAFTASAYFMRSVVGRIAIVQDNVARFEHGHPLRVAQSGSDEIAELDRGFHAMAAALVAGRSELERANSELEAFSYSVSHDLRAPLRAVDGYARMIEEDYGPALDGEARRFLGVIRSETRRMAKLIDDLLAFSRLGRASLSLAEVDIASMSEEVLRDLRDAASGRPVELLYDDVPPAMGDRSMLRQVLLNLLSNAIKYSKPEGPIVVRLEGSAGADLNTYCIRDFGVGFDMRYAGKLFGVFQRLHGDEEFEGTGVGLAIVKRVIARHGGGVWAESRLGEGSTFYFTLPAVRPALQDAASAGNA